jgi:hypothetical protein
MSPRAATQLSSPAKTDWPEIEKTLAAMVTAGCVEVHEDGHWLAELSDLHYELKCDGKNSLVHLWSDERNLVRRILRVLEYSPQRIVFEVRRFGRNRPSRLEFLSTDGARTPSRVSVETFRARFSRTLAENFPDANVESLTGSPDLEHSLSGLYVRGVMAEGRHGWAVLAAPPGSSAATVAGALTFGLLWLDWSRERATRRPIEGLRMFLPEGAARETRQRLRALASFARVEICELTENGSRVRTLDLADTGNLESWLTPRREVEGALTAAGAVIESVRAANDRAAENIAAAVRPGAKEVALRFRGLEFARYAEGQIAIGVGDARREAGPLHAARIESLLRELDFHRNPLAHERNHPFYRAAPERWIETLIQRDPAQLDAQLDSRFFYSQVPAFAAADRGVIDLLGVTLHRRLVVIELKASEDIQLPMQAVDYWLRVRQHLERGDFQRYGYFPGIELDPRPPLVWLVAPALRFHPATEIILKYLSSEIQVTRIGLNEEWRRGIRVVFRQ